MIFVKAMRSRLIEVQLEELRKTLETILEALEAGYLAQMTKKRKLLKQVEFNLNDD